MVRGGDVDRLDLRIVHEVFEPGIGPGALGLGRRAGGLARIRDGDEPMPGRADARRHVVACDPAVADDAPGDGVLLRRHHQRSGRST